MLSVPSSVRSPPTANNAVAEGWDRVTSITEPEARVSAPIDSVPPVVPTRCAPSAMLTVPPMLPVPESVLATCTLPPSWPMTARPPPDTVVVPAKAALLPLSASRPVPICATVPLPEKLPP